MEHFTRTMRASTEGCEMAIIKFCHSLCRVARIAQTSQVVYSHYAKRPQTILVHSSLCLQLLLDLAAGLDALKYALTVLVQLQLGDNNLGGVDTDGD